MVSTAPRPIGAEPGPPPRTIAVLAPFVGGFYFGNLLAGAARAAALGGHALLAVQTLPAGLDRGEDPDAPPHDTQVTATQLAAIRLAARGASGLVVINKAVRGPALDGLHRLGRPIVLISADVSDRQVPLAGPDNVSGVRSAVDHLVGHSHRRIGFVGTLAQPDIMERYQAYREALRGHGISPDPRWFFEAPDTLEAGGRHAARQLLEAGRPTSALIAGTDRNALGVGQVLAEAGLSLPREQAIIGFDNTEAGARARPRLSTVEPHFDRVGELAVQLLIGWRRSGQVRAGRHSTPTSLVIRESCGCAGPKAGGTDQAAVLDTMLDAQLRRQGELEAAIAAQVEIGMELMRPGRTDPRRLDWMSASQVSAACLGLWREPDGDAERTLAIAGVRDAHRDQGDHDGSGSLDPLVGVHLGLGEFPPAEVKRRCGAGGAEAVIVIPVTTERRDWGLLAVVGSVEHRATSVRDNYNHWATLLAVALEQDELLASEQQQRDDLEQAYRRERELADSVRVSEERYALVAGASHDGLWDWDVSAGRVYYSPRWKSMLGYDEAEIGDTPGEWLDRVHPDHQEALAAAVAAQLGGASSPLELELRVRTKDGDYRWVLCRALTVVDAAGYPTRLVGALVDLADRKALEEQLQRGALYDEQTGLANRALFLDRLAVALARAQGRPSPGYDFALLVIRLDLSEPEGETPPAPSPELLRPLADRLRAGLEDLDCAGRLGPAELAVLLDSGSGRDVADTADRLEAALGAAVTIGDRPVRPQISCGLVLRAGSCGSIEAVLREADIARHRAQATTRRRRPD
jgi:PAS domain S-box-containing protein